MQRKPIIVVTDPIHRDGVEILRQFGEVREHAYSSKFSDQSSLMQDLSEADIMVLRAMRITPELLDQCPNLKMIARHGIGTDHIDLQAATSRGIVVTNTGDVSSSAVAEAAVTLMLATLRRIPDLHQAVLEERFAANWHIDHWNIALGEVWGQTLGLISFGNIARYVARMCGNGFNMKVIAYDPYVSAEEMASLNVEKVDLDHLMQQADIVSVHAPLTPETRYMVGARELSMMKSSAIIVHTSRGGVVDEKALYESLANGSIGGAGIDVYEQEPPRCSNPLLTLKNVVLSPHVGARTESTLRRVAHQLAHTVIDVFEGKKPAMLVNVEVWDKRRIS